MYNKNVYKYDEMKRREHMAVRNTVGWYFWTHQLALDNDIASQAATIAVFLLGQTRKGNSYIDVFMFFRRYTETDRDAAEAIVFIKILCRHN